MMESQFGSPSSGTGNGRYGRTLHHKVSGDDKDFLEDSRGGVDSQTVYSIASSVCGQPPPPPSSPPILTPSGLDF